LSSDTTALSDPYEIRERLDDLVDLIINAGVIDYEPTTIIDCTGGFVRDCAPRQRHCAAVRLREK